MINFIMNHCELIELPMHIFVEDHVDPINELTDRLAKFRCEMIENKLKSIIPAGESLESLAKKFQLRSVNHNDGREDITLNGEIILSFVFEDAAYKAIEYQGAKVFT